MSIIIPDSIKFAVLNFDVETPTSTNTTDHLITTSRLIATHRYVAKLELVPLKKGRTQRFAESLFESINGRYNIVQIKIPEASYLLGNMTGNVTVATTANKGATQITLTTDSGSIGEAFYSGTFLQFGNHTKAYKVIGDFDSVANSLTVELTLPLLQEVPAATVVNYDNIYFSMRQRKDKRSFKLDSVKKHANSVLDLEEDL